MSARSELMQFYAWIRKDVRNFAKACGIRDLTHQHKELVDALNRREPKISVRSGQGPGKTFCSSFAGLWRSIQWPNHKLIVTAPSMRQCKGVWLAQAKKHVDNPDANPLLKHIFKFTGSGYGVFGKHQEIWGCMLLTASKDGNVRGQHEKNMDIIVEEASECNDRILDVLIGTQTNKNGLFMMIGNPSRREGFFFESHNSQKHKWKCIHWDGEETPDSEWFNSKRNKEMADKYGVDSDFYRINVKGNFPKSDPDGVISEENLRWCMEHNNMYSMARLDRTRQIGIDYARFGSDESAVAFRKGNAIFRLDAFNKREPADVNRHAFRIQKDMSWPDSQTTYVPDSVGMGQGVLHMLIERKKTIVRFHPLAKVSGKEFYDQQSRAWFCLRDLVNKRLFWMPKDDRAFKQLVTRKFETQKGLIKVEPKDTYMERGPYDSPDRADAIVQAFAQPTGINNSIG